MAFYMTRAAVTSPIIFSNREDKGKSYNFRQVDILLVVITENGISRMQALNSNYLCLHDNVFWNNTINIPLFES